MSVTLSDEVLQDDLALLLVRAIAAANKCARESGIDVAQSFVSITQSFDNGPHWNVNYGAKDYIGRRGGDLIVEVDAANSSVMRVRRGQ